MELESYDRPIPTLTTTLRRAAVLSSLHKREARPMAQDISAWLEARGVETRVDLQGEGDLRPVVEGCDLAVIAGGDGTILGIARRLAAADVEVPCVGVNVGKLGFLAEFSRDEALAVLEGKPIVEGLRPLSARVVPRMMLRCRIRHRGKQSGIHEHIQYALNDAVVTQGIPTRLIKIRLSVDGREATEYHADGLVVSTPIGSTAYSLSLGGPILTPTLRAMAVTPIAPHSLTNRPIVVSGQSVLKLKVFTHAEQIALVLDGQEVRTLDLNDEIEATGHDRPFLLASHGDRSFFDLLRAKFHWGMPPRHGV